MDRVRRCAKFDGKTVQEICWYAIAEYVRCAEEDDMIFAPDGEVIGSKVELDELLWEATNA
jgi:hypothetical protein